MDNGIGTQVGSGGADDGSARTDSFALDRLLPQDLEIEVATFDGILLGEEAVTNVIDVLRGPEFYHSAHESIFDVIVEIYSRSEPVGPLIVVDGLSKRGKLGRIGGAPYLAILMATAPIAASVGYYARIVKDKALMRGLAQAGTRITQLGYSADASDIVGFVALAGAEVYSVARHEEEEEDYIVIPELLGGANLEIEAAQDHDNGALIGVPTGFTELNELTGRLHPGQMIIVAARPTMGKSTLAMGSCRSASIYHGITSCYFSLEMGHVGPTMRILAAESGVNMNKLRDSCQMENRDWTDVVVAYNPVFSTPLFVGDSPSLTMPEIRSKTLRVRQQYNLGFTVVDYLQLMSSGKCVESRQQKIPGLSRSLKLLAEELEIPMIAVAQLNRGPEQHIGNKPQMSDLRESGSLEQDAGIIIPLHRPKYYNNEEHPGEADIIVAKHRNGQTRTILVAFQGHTSRFANMARDVTPGPAYEQTTPVGDGVGGSVER